RRAHLQQPDIVRSDLSGELCAVIDTLRLSVGVEPDPAAEERPDGVALLPREIKERRSLKEESTAFGKEKWELREVHESLIDFGFGKIRIDREVRLELRRNAVSEIDSGISLV